MKVHQELEDRPALVPARVWTATHTILCAAHACCSFSQPKQNAGVWGWVICVCIADGVWVSSHGVFLWEVIGLVRCPSGAKWSQPQVVVMVPSPALRGYGSKELSM